MILLQNFYLKILCVCIIITFTISCLIAVLPISFEECKCNSNVQQKDKSYLEQINNHDERRPAGAAVSSTASSDAMKTNNNNNWSSSHRLAILVPFRDRFEELLQFAPHMHTFLTDQRIRYEIFVLNQVDRYRFNRASLINAGFLYTKFDFDYIAMHDVDLLPINRQLRYDYPGNGGPFHVAAPTLHPKYHYQTFVGGILLVTREHFEQMNGMSNKYWGWGLEDDEFYTRIKDAGLTVHRPVNITTGTSNTFLHIHDREHRKRDTAKCFNQKEVTRKRDRETGLNTLRHTVSETRRLTIDGVAVTLLNIKLECDKQLTPWCDCNDSAAGKH